MMTEKMRVSASSVISSEADTSPTPASWTANGLVDCTARVYHSPDMTGLQQELRDRIVGSSPHIYVYNRAGITDYHAEIAKLKQVPHVTGAAPAILGRALVSAQTRTEPLQVKGIDPTLEPAVTDIKSAILTGSLEALAPRNEDDVPGVLLGKDLAATLGVMAGDSINLTTPEGILTPNGRMPYPRRLRVAGTFSLGLYEFDTTIGYVTLDAARRLFAKDGADLIQLRVDDIWSAATVARSIEATLGEDYSAQDWGSMNRQLFSALALEKIAVSLAIGLIVMVAALNIIASLILLVMEKNRDIAILKTMGASAKSVTAIFMGLLVTQLNANLVDRKLTISLTPEVVDWIIEVTCKDRSYGARPLRRAIQRYVEDPLSEELIRGHLRAGEIEVYLDAGQLAYRPAGELEAGRKLA